MPVQALFGLSVVFSFVAWGIVAAHYIWPTLRDRALPDALRPLLMLHAFRFIGLSFLIPGVVSPNLPAAFAAPAAYGGIVAMILALLALATLRTRVGIALVWIFNLWGTADLLLAFYHGNSAGLMAGDLGAAYFIPTVIVPLALITHALMFRLLLLRRSSESRVSRIPLPSASG